MFLTLTSATTDLETLTTDDNDTHLLIFRDDTLTVQSLDAGRLDIEPLNLGTTILPNGIAENIGVECDRTFLDESAIISQVLCNHLRLALSKNSVLFSIFDKHLCTFS